MRRAGTVLAIGTVLLTAIMVLASALAVWTVRRPFPDYGRDMQVAGLVGDVEIIRDRYGIPTLWADTAEDLFRGQGFVHAQDRFWEMDVRRHVTAGRLSELFGETQIPADTFVRTLGWRRVAEAEVPLLSPTSRRYYEAYAAGVNAYLASRSGADLALPYAILGIRGLDYVPEPWTVADSLAWFKAMSWDLRHNIDQETSRALLSASLPPARIDELYPPFPYERQQTILSSQDLSSGGARVAAASARDAPGPTSPDVQEVAGPAAASGASVAPGPALPAGALGVVAATQRAVTTARAGGRLAGVGPAGIGPAGIGAGSNSWVVGPQRTRSGEALLANDPHLAPSLPSIWTQIGLRCRDVNTECPFDVQGFSFSGVPGVVIGHNGRVAWGFTMAYADTADLYLEKVQGPEYLTEFGMRALEVRTETIRVAGGPDVEIQVRATRHGPLISDASETYQQVGRDAPVQGQARTREPGAAVADPPGSPSARGTGYAVALRWTALRPARTGDAVFAISRAENHGELTRAMELFDSPVQNVVYATADGTIGYYVSGAIPRRLGFTGRDVTVGWTGTNDWDGMLSAEQKPQVINPASGFLATANEATVPSGYPYSITTDPNPAYRGDRIRQLLEDAPEMDNGASGRIAMDSHSGLAEFLVPVLLEVPALRGYYADGQRLLAEWDFTTKEDSAAAAYFASVWSNLLRLTFHDDIPPSQWPDGDARWFEVVRGLLADPLNAYWDDITTDTVVETRDEILDQALRAARDDCTRRMGKDPETWRWGRLHELSLEDRTLGQSGVPLLERLFNRGPFPVGGSDASPLATSWDASSGFGVASVPTMRMQVDFGDLDASAWVQLTGQSGHPFHPVFTDQFEVWRSGGALPMSWSDQARRRSAVHTMTLRPAPAE